jgi:hypothetical protein
MVVEIFFSTVDCLDTLVARRPWNIRKSDLLTCQKANALMLGRRIGHVLSKEMTFKTDDDRVVCICLWHTTFGPGVQLEVQVLS